MKYSALIFHVVFPYQNLSKKATPKFSNLCPDICYHKQICMRTSSAMKVHIPHPNNCTHYYCYDLYMTIIDKDIWSHGAAHAADLKGERVEDYYEILEELGR